MDKQLIEFLAVAIMTVWWMLMVYGCKVRYFTTAIPDLPVDAPLVQTVAVLYRIRRSRLLPWFAGIVLAAAFMIVQLIALDCLVVHHSFQAGLYVFTATLTILYAGYVQVCYEGLLPELTTLKRMIELRE